MQIAAQKGHNVSLIKAQKRSLEGEGNTAACVDFSSEAFAWNWYKWASFKTAADKNRWSDTVSYVCLSCLHSSALRQKNGVFFGSEL